MTKHNLTGIKAGDQVYVVWQKSRWSNGYLPEYTEVVRVGRKYGYIKRHGNEVPFCLATGYSHHSEGHNVRANGYGFDVYRNKDIYDTLVENEQAFARLKKRITHSYRGLIELTPSVVDKINKILDDEGYEG